ncbi:MAG: single-stranded DNA-binding protein [Deltaproteobacteria bacterium]|nr:single-stranded DNA-binding protein [Deltaproteobacteria bacterium]
MSLNKVLIMGNLGADPELRFTQSQTAVCTLRVATTDRRKDQSGEWVEHTEWHSVVVWGKQAENCNTYLKKGRQVFVEGRLQTRKWQDQTGNSRYSTEVVANNVQFIGGGRGGDSPRNGQADSMAPDMSPESLPAAPAVAFDDDDIPF